MNDQTTLTITLGNRGFDELNKTGDKKCVYERGFKYDISSSNNKLQCLVQGAFSSRRITDAGIQFDVLPPVDIPDGDYDIVVKAVPEDIQSDTGGKVFSDGNVPSGLIPPPTDIVGTTTISVITNLIETDSKVTLQRTFAGPTDDRALWPAIRNRTAAIGFDRYKAFIDCLFCENPTANPFDDVRTKIISNYVDDGCLDDPNDQKQRLSIYGPYAYGVLKLATQVFLTLESGVVIRDTTTPGKPKIFDIEKERIRVNDFSLTVSNLQTKLRDYLAPTDGNLPYLDRIVKNLITLDPQNIDEVLPYCLGVLQFRLTSPSLIELIWSYWLEEGMLVQTMNAIARRFQNRRGSANDPLGELEFDPLRPLNNLIWGFIQDEYARLTVPRRAHEYMHHYGLSLMGKAVPDLNPADSRSKFIEAFHNLLSAAARFFKEDSDTTVIADAFPLLNALKEVHLLLAEGAHNQFGDLTWTARAEMLTIQWMLARPEMKEFLRGRYMVPYQEDWMGAVDSMKKLQGWTDTTITHFYELAVMGERILLSVRYGDWSDIENIEDQAKNWARSNKPEIQIYIHGYRAVTGVDLAAEVTDSRDAATRYLQPSALLQRRLAEQMSAMPLGFSKGPGLVAARVSGQAALPRPGRPRLPAYRKEI
ncbi:MAG: hypothetical protein L0Z50_18625 [Verrucomicrobiales bacterium]|nr:hypothetical protein [Verrucomicrobiales bacterium]